jgi:phosphatidylserine decarboxylase
MGKHYFVILHEVKTCKLGYELKTQKRQALLAETCLFQFFTAKRFFFIKRSWYTAAMSPSSVLGRGPLAAPAYPFILTAGGLTLVFWLLNLSLLASLSMMATLFLLYFFRNPKRTIPADLTAIVSPADGKIILVDEVRENEFLGSPSRRVAIFMNVFDVHVNRAPVAGRAIVSRHRPGRFLAAFKEEAAQVNEQHTVLWETPAGLRVLTVQIAGLLARRIIPAFAEGDVLAKGAPFGIICFGSRVDLYIPRNCDIIVRVGDRVKAGESIVGRWT